MHAGFAIGDIGRLGRSIDLSQILVLVRHYLILKLEERLCRHVLVHFVQCLVTYCLPYNASEHDNRSVGRGFIRNEAIRM
jgi:hypothetical protein